MDTQGCVTVSGLLHFTALRALTKLTLKGWRCGRDVGNESSGVGYGAADHSGSITLAVSPDVSAVTPSSLKASTNAVLLLVWRNTLCTPCQADGRAGQILLLLYRGKGHANPVAAHSQRANLGSCDFFLGSCDITSDT
jgi:hypothetical protein